MSAKTKKAAPTVCRVIVTVSGGVADVLLKPKGVELCILDYDVDGVDEDRASRDPDGDACSMQQYAADEKILSHEHWPMVQNAARRINGHDRAKQRWQCPDCGRMVHCSDASLADSGTPFCTDCDQDLCLL